MAIKTEEGLIKLPRAILTHPTEMKSNPYFKLDSTQFHQKETNQQQQQQQHRSYISLNSLQFHYNQPKRGISGCRFHRAEREREGGKGDARAI